MLSQRQGVIRLWSHWICFRCLLLLSQEYFGPSFVPFFTGVLFQMLSACCSGAEEKFQVFMSPGAEHPLPDNKTHHTPRLEATAPAGQVQRELRLP